MNSFISNFKKNHKKVLVELLGLCALLFLFDRLLFMAIQHVEASFYTHYSPYSLNDKFAGIENKEQYRILIFGTSRTYDAIHPYYIKKQLGVLAFKEAFVGKGPMYNYYFYHEYKKNMGIPRVVIYGVDYFLYNITSERHWMQRFSKDIVKDLYRKPGISLLLANKAGIDSFCNTVLNNLLENPNHNKNVLIERDISRMEGYLGKSSMGDIAAEEPPHYDKYFFFPYPGQEGVYFSRLLEELHRDKVMVLLVSLPEYEGTYRSNKSHRIFRRAFRLFQRKFANVRFLNYNHAATFDLANTKYFIDGGYGKTNSHLSLSGAKILNRMLIDDLRKSLNENEIQKRK